MLNITEEKTCTKLNFDAKNKDFSKKKSLIGLYIDNDKAYYVNGYMENFKAEISISSSKNLENGLRMHYNCFSSKEQNRFAITYLGINVKGPIIITKNNKFDFDKNIHITLSANENKRELVSCESCKNLLLSNDLLIENIFEKKCNLKIENFICVNIEKHSHLFCRQCNYFIQLYR